MNTKDIVGKFGGQTALAQMLGVGQSAIAYWVKRDSIPSKWHSKLLSIANLNGVDILAADLITVDLPGRQLANAPSKQTEAEVLGGGGFLQRDQQLNTEPQQFLFYASDKGTTKVQVMIGEETVWASQKGLAEIFDVTVSTINEHLQNAYENNEIEVSTTIRKSRIVVDNGNEYLVNFYNLDAIISVGYRVNSYKATQFRKWATTVLREYLVKGFTLDDDRLKQGGVLFGKDYFDELLERIREIRASERRFYQKITDIYSQCSIDYDKNSPISMQFYAHVQDKLHFAIHGHTSAELIQLRADAAKPHMGLTFWKNENKGGKVTKYDVTIGKNYLSQDEVNEMNRLVSMYLDWAENFARRQVPLTMKDWAEKLDGFLRFNAYDVLSNYGTVRRETAEKSAFVEYEKFRVVQDKEFHSDFDKVVDEIKFTKSLSKKVIP
jgi:hypothetical protein